MQDQKSLTLRWRSFLGGGSDMVIGSFAHKGGQYCHYGLRLARSLDIIQDARPENGDQWFHQSGGGPVQTGPVRV